MSLIRPDLVPLLHQVTFPLNQAIGELLFFGAFHWFTKWRLTFHLLKWVVPILPLDVDGVREKWRIPISNDFDRKTRCFFRVPLFGDLKTHSVELVNRSNQSEMSGRDFSLRQLSHRGALEPGCRQRLHHADVLPRTFDPTRLLTKIPPSQWGQESVYQKTEWLVPFCILRFSRAPRFS